MSTGLRHKVKSSGYNEAYYCQTFFYLDWQNGLTTFVLFTLDNKHIENVITIAVIAFVSS